MSRSRRRLIVGRVLQLLSAMGTQIESSTSVRSMLEALESTVDAASKRDMWFAITVLTASFALEEDVVDAARRGRVNGVLAALEPHLAPASGLAQYFPAVRRRAVEIVSDEILVDVDHTSRVEFATGIQRVVRETVKRWNADHFDELVLVGWTGDRTALRRLTPSQQIQALTGAPNPAPRTPVARLRETLSQRFRQTALVPLRGSYVLPELSLERNSLFRSAALAQFSDTYATAIAFDAVPITSSETVNFLVSGGFASYLSAVKHFDRIAVISEAAASEYVGWKRMLAGTGLVGPGICAISLPSVVEMPGDPGVAMAEARSEFVSGDTPLVLCVGSHEPRKNHMSVLHAAEVLWREGLKFTLLFVGGNSWNSGDFVSKIRELQDLHAPLRAVQSVSDDQLWGLYRLASFTVFPSLNEGFGLPVAESIAAGVPVMTSAFGATKEVAQRGGALFIDPRQQNSVTSGMRALLTDRALRDRLANEAAGAVSTTWESYAAQTWAFLVARDRPIGPA